MPIYSIDNMHVSYAIGTDLTSWDNTDYAALVVGEIQATDLLDPVEGAIAVEYSYPEVGKSNHMSASQYPIQYTKGYKTARVDLPMYLQTGVFAYATFGTCSTGAGPPYTHSITLNTSQTPISLALHWEKELSSEDLRYDFFGFMPESWNVRCGDTRDWRAKQRFIGQFAKSDNTASELAEPSKQSLSTYEWSDLKHASGMLQFQYNSNDLEIDVRHVDFTYTRTKPLWGAKNASGYPSEAFISGANFEVNVDCYIKGDNVKSTMETKPEDYAGDLNIDLKWYKSASREFYINIDKAYLVPHRDVINETAWYEQKTLTFIPYDSNTTVAISPEDSLDKTYYEND